MIKRILPIALLSAAIIGNTGCSSNGGMKQINGVSYKIIKDAPGKNAKMGDIVEYHIYVKVDTLPGKALVLADSRKQGQPSAGRVDSVKQPGDFQAIFPMLSAGDSALVEVSCDTILKTIPPAQMGHLPTWLKKGNKVVISMAVISIKTMDEYKKDMQAKQEQMQAEMKAKAEAQKPIDDKILQDFFAKNNIKATKTASGLYYTIEKPGAGAQITKGQMASVMYTGKTLDGKAFDSNIDTAIGHHGTEPLKFIVGAGQMIPGMDEGVTFLKKGSKATLYLPSPLAYGAQGAGQNIGPNTILMFEVEVTDAKAAPAPEAPASMPAQ
ncbi:MAG: FKBP-type peptidyl-prolyl cis-trans isomerase [Flavipsychrobacter sp.]|nr:FKBP-type peptidyl-prolyl cis-trans isomerase [Flavipsychrobacter sp.]